MEGGLKGRLIIRQLSDVQPILYSRTGQRSNHLRGPKDKLCLPFYPALNPPFFLSLTIEPFGNPSVFWTLLLRFLIRQKSKETHLDIITPQNSSSPIRYFFYAQNMVLMSPKDISLTSIFSNPFAFFISAS